MEDDAYFSLIFERPFLAKTRAIIDMKNGKLTFDIRNKKVEFNLFQSTKQPSYEGFKEKYPKDPLESLFVYLKTTKHKNVEIAAYT